jgi:DNA helicase HerA-like ATPase
MSKSHAITVGRSDAGPVKLEVPRLIVSRGLITADSGGGKSWLLRKVLEQVSKTTQTIVFDPEAEFATLRELRDMVLVGPTARSRPRPTRPRSSAGG